ncbi:MAG: hypothetical protein ACR2N4_17955 [Jatrophihabitans sp.]
MSVPALCHGLFDDAALFPPGNAAMPDAVTGHLAYRQAWYAELLGLFVCPSARLAELDATIRQHRSDPLAVSMTVPGGLAELPGALRLAGSLPGIHVRAVELPVRTPDAPDPLISPAALASWTEQLQQAVGPRLTSYAEVALDQLTLPVATALAAAGVGLKLRTGGLTAAAFPSVAGLGSAIAAAVAAGVRFKCTAGLHHPVAHTDPATGFAQHGFLNVLLAVHAAGSGGDPAAALAERDSALIARQAGALPAAQVVQLRDRFRSIGSCSIIEPLTDLTDLGVVAVP